VAYSSYTVFLYMCSIPFCGIATGTVLVSGNPDAHLSNTGRQNLIELLFLELRCSMHFMVVAESSILTQ